MVSDRLAAGIRVAVGTFAGGAAAWSAASGLYATTVLALLVAGWTAAAAVIATRPPMPLPPPAAMRGEDDHRRLTAYLDLSPAPLVVLEAGVLRAVNRAARRLFGADDVLPAPPGALLEALAHTQPGRTATVTLELAGMPRPFALAAGELLLAGRGAQVGALIDIDAELKAAEATALRELVQILSHEIVNALTPIASLADTVAAMLHDTPLELEAVREAAETIARRAGGLQRFGDAYRSLARLPAPKRTRIATADLVADLARLFAVRWPAIPLAVDMQHAPPIVIADADQLTAALWAILQNAAEATERDRPGAVTLTASRDADGAVVTIGNDGPAVPADLTDSIFHPFMTTKPSGSGVGLALARQIVRGHGGDVRLLPRIDDHTRFEARLPLPRGF